MKDSDFDAARIYYVEDDEHIRRMTAYALEQVGFSVRAFPDGSGLFQACAENIPDIILLDIMLPGEDGLEILRRIRADEVTADVPVMMLTAKGTEFDTVCGLDAGADDYLAKPFGIMELISRVNALLRRADMRARRAEASSSASSPKVAREADLSSGLVALSPSAHQAWAGGTSVPLTVKEFDLLHALMMNEGLVLSRDQLLDLVWDMHFAGETRTVDAHVKTLRQKLAQVCPGAEEHIVTVRGVGYVFKGDAR